MDRIVNRIGMDRSRALPLSVVGLVFLAGLLLGWLTIGWWLWPVDWIDADPWDLRAEHQERYVALVAKDYAQAGNADQARGAMAGWDDQTLADLLAAMQEAAPDLTTSRQLADLASALDLPEGGAAAPAGSEASPATPSLRNRLATVCGTAGVVLAAAGLIIFAASTRVWESFARGAQRVLPTPTVPTEEPEPISGHFTTIFTRDQDDYAEYFPIQASNGQFLGECGLKSIGGVSVQGIREPVTALEMVLLDSLDHCTETRILMSRYAYGYTPLRRELMTRGELVLTEPGTEVLVETNNIQMLATIMDVEYVDQEPAEGVFLRVVADLDVEVKHLPQEPTAEAEPGSSD